VVGVDNIQFVGSIFSSDEADGEYIGPLLNATMAPFVVPKFAQFVSPSFVFLLCKSHRVRSQEELEDMCLGGTSDYVMCVTTSNAMWLFGCQKYSKQ
jgi:hypothetical protein